MRPCRYFVISALFFTFGHSSLLSQIGNTKGVSWDEEELAAKFEKEQFALKTLLAKIKNSEGEQSLKYLEHSFDEVSNLTLVKRTEEAQKLYNQLIEQVSALRTKIGKEAEKSIPFRLIESSMLRAQEHLFAALGDCEASIAASEKRLQLMEELNTPESIPVRLNIMAGAFQTLVFFERHQQAREWMERLLQRLADPNIILNQSNITPLKEACISAEHLGLGNAAKLFIDKARGASKLVAPDTDEAFWTLEKACSFANSLDEVEALSAEMKAAVAREEKLPSPDQKRLVRGYWQIGIFFTKLARLQNKKVLFKDALGAIELSGKAMRTLYKDSKTVKEYEAMYDMNAASLRLYEDPSSSRLQDFRNSIVKAEKVLPASESRVFSQYLALSGYHLADNRVKQAADIYEYLLIQGKKPPGLTLADKALCHHQLGRCQALLGKNDAAVKSFEKAAALRETAFGPMHPDVARSYYNLGALRKAAGDLAGARAYFEHVYKIDSSSNSPASDIVCDDVDSIASVLANEGRSAESEKMLLRHISLMNDQNDPLRIHRGFINLCLCSLYRSRGQNGDAEALYQSVIDAMPVDNILCADRLATTHEQFALLRVEQGRFAEAALQLEKAIQARWRLNASDSTQERKIKENTKFLSDLLKKTGLTDKVIQARIAALNPSEVKK